VIERVTIAGNLLTLYESTLRFSSATVIFGSQPKTFSPAATDDSPMPPAQIIIAELCLRPFQPASPSRLALRELPTRLHIFDRSLELINPRRTAGFSPLAQKAIRYGVPQRLNPQSPLYFPAARTDWNWRQAVCQCCCAKAESSRTGARRSTPSTMSFACASMVRETGTDGVGCLT